MEQPKTSDELNIQQEATTADVTRIERGGDNRAIAEFCGYGAVLETNRNLGDCWFLTVDGIPSRIGSERSEEHVWKFKAPKFFTDPAAFVELLRVCAARGVFHLLEMTSDGRSWHVVLLGKYKICSAMADTECEALALAVLELIKQENSNEYDFRSSRRDCRIEQHSSHGLNPRRGRAGLRDCAQ